MAPRAAQEGPKSGTTNRKKMFSAPRSPQDAPRGSQGDPRGSQEGQKRPQNRQRPPNCPSRFPRGFSRDPHKHPRSLSPTTPAPWRKSPTGIAHLPLSLAPPLSSSVFGVYSSSHFTPSCNPPPPRPPPPPLRPDHYDHSYSCNRRIACPPPPNDTGTDTDTIKTRFAATPQKTETTTAQRRAASPPRGRRCGVSLKNQCFWPPQALSGILFSTSWAVLGPSWSVLRPSEAILERSWTDLGPL